MRALQITDLNISPEIREVAIPEPTPDQVRIKIEACGLNFADLLMMKGQYQERPELPFTLGMEVCGVVDACGENVTSPAAGTRIAVFGGQGGLAEYGCFEAARCVEVPGDMPPAQAAGFLVAYGTSHLALTYRAKLTSDDTLVVLGAAGGVGLTAVEIGVQLGAKVIACARGSEKLAAAQAAGAHHLIDSETDDIAAQIKELGGADVVYDPVGGDQFKAALRGCNRQARFLTIGFASGDVPQIPANILLVKNLTVMGFYWGGYLAIDPKPLTDSLSALMTLYRSGRLKPHVSHVLPLDRAVEALDLLRTRQSTGKVVVSITSP